MKKLILVLGLLLACASGSQAHFTRHGGIGFSFNIFYSSLGSYGEWIPVGGHVYAWRPVGVAVGWRPYMYGRWAWTEDGWYWASDEPWGWAVFHYGRWYYDDYYGWIWIPGYDWAPAWVEWRFGGPAIGWAPLGPYAVFQIGIGIHYPKHWATPHHYWTFVDCRYISSPSLHRHVYRTEYNRRYIGTTRTGGSVRYEGGRIKTRGPEREYVEQRGNVRIERAEVVDARDRGQERILRDSGRERIEVFRPRIEGQAHTEMVERPARVREDDRRISLDARKTDIGMREAIREPAGEIQRSGESGRRDEVKAPPGTQTPERSERRIERSPVPEESSPPKKVERRREESFAPAQKREDLPREERQVRPERTPRIDNDARKEPQPRRESVDRPGIQREESKAPVQRGRIQKDRERSESPELMVRRPEVKRDERPAEVRRGERRGRDQ